MSRVRGIDPWGPLAALVAMGVFLLQWFHGPLSRDVSVYAYAGQQVAEGVPPYVQILNRAGPLAHLVPGAGAALGRAVGADDLMAMRALMAGVSALAVWAAYVLGRDLYGSRLAGLMTATTLLSFQGFVTYATTGPREKTLMVLFILLALWAVTRRRWVAAGATTALATLSWQGSFFPVAAVVLVAVLALPGWRPRIAALVRFAAAGLAVTAVAALYFVAVGAVAEFYEAFYAVNAGYTSQRGILTLLESHPERLVTGFGWSLALLVAGVVASFVVAGVRLRHLDRDAPGEVTVVGLALGTLVCVLWGLMSFEGWPDAFLFLPFAACGLAGLGQLLVSRSSHPVAPRVGGVVVALLLVATATTAVLNRSTELLEQRRHNAAVLAVLDDPDLLAINNPAPLVLAHARNPLRYQLFAGGQGTYLKATYPGGLRGLGREIERLSPTFITIFQDPPGWLRPVLERGYERVGGRRKPYVWYVSTSATTEAERTEIRRVAGRTLRAGPSDVRRSLP